MINQVAGVSQYFFSFPSLNIMLLRGNVYREEG